MADPTTARAAVCRTHGDPLTIETVTVSPPGSDEIRVDIAVCAICHSDIIYANGGWGGELPAIYGHEAAGTIEAVGARVTDLAVGQRVIIGLLRSCGECYHCVREEENLCIGDFESATPFTGADGTPIVRGLRTGAFGGQTVVHQSQAVPLPDDVSLEAACLLACSVLAGFGSVANISGMTAGSTAAVIGLGGVGLSAIQGAVHTGASVLIAVDRVDSKLDIAAELGSTHSINSVHQDAVAAPRAATGGIGPDYVFVAVGSKPAIDEGLNMVRTGGTVVLIGMPPSGVMLETEATWFADRSLTLMGSKMGSGRMAVDVPYLIDLYRSGELKLDEMITNTYPLDEINEAIDGVVAGRAIRNLVVFDG